MFLCGKGSPHNKGVSHIKIHLHSDTPTTYSLTLHHTTHTESTQCVVRRALISLILWLPYKHLNIQTYTTKLPTLNTQRKYPPNHKHSHKNTTKTIMLMPSRWISSLSQRHLELPHIKCKMLDLAITTEMTWREDIHLMK